MVEGKDHPQYMPEFDESLKCPQHPKAKVQVGFGLAGGGYGSYTYCEQCAKVLSKSQDNDE